jgi:hypothetical protein
MVVPTTVVPVQPILLSRKTDFAMFDDLRRRHNWVLSTYLYDPPNDLIANLAASDQTGLKRKLLRCEACILHFGCASRTIGSSEAALTPIPNNTMS